MKIENRILRPRRPPCSSVKFTNCSTAGANFVIAKSRICEDQRTSPGSQSLVNGGGKSKQKREERANYEDMEDGEWGGEGRGDSG
jgi:hypothetical protein